jgi:hypothetical protein
MEFACLFLQRPPIISLEGNPSRQVSLIRSGKRTVSPLLDLSRHHGKDHGQQYDDRDKDENDLVHPRLALLLGHPGFTIFRHASSQKN